jgi:accessory colonization factor AcfC
VLLNRNNRCARCIALVSMAAWGAATAAGQNNLRLYGPLGLDPAVEEASIVFAARHGIKLEVTTGPMEEWRDQAALDGDIIYCGGEFIMSDFIRDSNVPVDETSVIPLKIRPAAILVRPGNPKDIRDFPDLLRPGMHIMLVNGSGQTGLWENMTGRLQSLQNLVALQGNIDVCAADTQSAMETWLGRPDIDAWVTWNVWHMPRRESAYIVRMSEDYQIYRQASVALTQRGRRDPLAGAFAEFLASREGGDIFQSWGWIDPPADVNPAIASRGVCVACQIRKDVWTNTVGRGLDRVHRLVEEYRSLGIPEKDIHICALFDEEAAYWMLNDDVYKLHTRGRLPNPNKELILQLVNAGVSVEVSEEALASHGWTAGDVLSGVTVVTNAPSRIADLGRKGYSYLPF